MTNWLHIQQGSAPLIVSMPHAGTIIPPEVQARLISPWRAIKDTDWWISELYANARELDATIIRTDISRSVIDVNRDPSGQSLYPGQTTTGLCPVTTFDGESLYRDFEVPDGAEIERRRQQYFVLYHAALGDAIERLGRQHARVTLYDAHSIRSRVPRLFDGLLPHFNIGTNSGASCDVALTRAVEACCADSPFTHTTNGRFRGGWITRHYGQPDRHIHAIQMELAMRSYLDEPEGELTPTNWPPAYDPERAAGVRSVLAQVLRACLRFAGAPTGELA